MWVMASKSVIGPKGQITIPKQLREEYHLLEGEEVILIEEEEGILVRHPSSALRGSLRGKLDVKGFDRDVRGLRSKWRL